MVGKVGFLFLICWGFISSEPLPPKAQPRSETLDFGIVPSGVYETNAYYTPGSIGILFHIVHAFLHVVQPNPFPRELITKMAHESFRELQAEYKKPENVVMTLQAIYYEMGFIVCASLGALFVLLMPLVGLCFCMCRCCENCGGEMHQRQRKSADCQRSFLASMLLGTSLLISAGALCAYAGNQNLSLQLKSIRRMVNSNMRDMQTFANQTPTQIDFLIAQYAVAKNQVVTELETVGPTLASRIHKKLGKDVIPALDSILSMAQAMRETKDALETMNMALKTLQEGSGQLQSNLSLVRASIEEALDDPVCVQSPATPTCTSVRDSLLQLTVNANFSGLPDVGQQLDSVTNVLKTDLSNVVRKGYTSFNETPTMVQEQTINLTKDVKGILDGIGSDITSFSKKFPVQSSLNNFTMLISHSHSKIEDYYPTIDKADFYRWICCITLCCMVVLILAFNFLGLLLGICGHDKHASPTTRGCISNTGGNLLMAGVGFSFIFSWVLMGVVASTFVVGGNLEKLVCEPFETKQLFQVMDTPYLVNPAWKNFIPGFLYNNPEIDLTVDSVYSNCKLNRGIYSALHLDNIFNITAVLNISLYTKDVTKAFEDVKVDLTGIVLLQPEGKQNLLSFNSTGVGHINYPAYLEEANKGLTRVDLLSFANDLEAKADQLPQGTLRSALKEQAVSLRRIHSLQVVPMQNSTSSLNQSVRLLQKTTSDLPNKISTLLNNIDGAQYLISHNASSAVKQEATKYSENLIDYFVQYAEWVRTSLAMRVAPCKPISNIIDTVETVACSFIVDSMNTFWFGLGCAAIFLIPSVILSVRLAKFYRRMDTEDVYDDVEAVPMNNMEIGVNGYHNEQLQGIQNPVMTSAMENWN